MVNPRPDVLRTAFSELRDVTTLPVVRSVRVAACPLRETFVRSLLVTVVPSVRVALPRLEFRVTVCPFLEAVVPRSFPRVARTAVASCRIPREVPEREAIRWRLS